VPHSDSLRVLIQGNPVGGSLSTLRRTADSLVYSERSDLGPVFQQQTTVVLDPSDGSPRLLDQVTVQQGQKAETHLKYAEARVKGRIAVPQQDGTVRQFDIDTVLPPGTLDENTVPVVVPAFPLAPGKTFTVGFFSPSEKVTKPLTFKVAAPERVSVPAGVFQAYHIDVSGARVPLIIWVSVDTPRRVVKTEFVGQPFVVELVK